MERASKDQFKRVSLRDEHIHRYELAADIASGFVVDCACGIGYSSEILASRVSVESYLGIDPSEDAIEYARNNFTGERISFEKGTLESNSCVSSSVDTFLMFETLEHTADPDLAIANIRRALKMNGLLIGSVPSAEYEELCEKTYGANSFHLQRFTREKISAILSEHFDCVWLYSAEYMLGTLIRDLSVTHSSEAEVVSGLEGKVEVAGSFIFLAGSKDRVQQAVQTLGVANKYYPSIPKVILDRDEVEPIRAAFHQAERLVRERDDVILAQARMLEERWAIMQSMESMIRERDEQIKKTSKSIFKNLNFLNKT
jgi:2-polyprenyl-3-methyl-5-hydroxy-6-metoxy-1,4-benzoquinol methylase